MGESFHSKNTLPLKGSNTSRYHTFFSFKGCFVEMTLVANWIVFVCSMTLFALFVIFSNLEELKQGLVLNF
jgi:hypothetical protein